MCRMLVKTWGEVLNATLQISGKEVLEEYWLASDLTCRSLGGGLISSFRDYLTKGESYSWSVAEALRWATKSCLSWAALVLFSIHRRLNNTT